MLFLAICLIIVFLTTVYLQKYRKIKYSVSTGFLSLIILSLIANICLSQNYTQSIIPNSSDGIAISNQIAYLIIGEDHWTPGLFKAYFDMSLYATIVLLVLFLVSVVMESKKHN